MSRESGDVPEVAELVGRRVLVVGDVMLDEYVTGRVERVSPEAPVPVVLVGDRSDGLGGAANVAHQLAALGGSVRLVGLVGDDAAGGRVRERCAAAGIDHSGIVVDRTRPTTRKIRVLADAQQVLRMDWEDRHEVGAAAAEALVAALVAGPAPEAVVVSDYAKGVLRPDVAAAVLDRAAAWGVPVLVDSKAPDLDRFRGATVVKLNRAEAEAASGRPVGGSVPDEAGSAARALRASLDVDAVVVTLGDQGLVVADAIGERWIPVEGPGDVFDVSGAGDTVIAVLASGLAAGRSAAEVAPLANLAAGLVVARSRVAVVEAEELADRARRGGAAKVVGRGRLAEWVDAWRAAGRRVVFTNGCFDLFHAGHLHLLRSAAELGDVLVVGVDDDASVRRLKGADRPLVRQHERSAMIAGLDCVDAVVVFGNGELAELVATIGPDVLVKGGDYEGAEVVGRDVVEARGGRVELVPLLDGWSTTQLVAHIRGRE